MSTAIALRRQRARNGIGMPGDNSVILRLARRLRDRVDAPVVGGIAVYLHGVGRSTVDLDFYAVDRKEVAAQLEAAGAVWNVARREHVLDGVPIHTVTPHEAGVEVRRTSVIDGIRVVSLRDLIAIKMICGLKHATRARDIGDVQDLVRAVPLTKEFAPKLPKELRADFKKLVEAIRAEEEGRSKGSRF